MPAKIMKLVSIAALLAAAMFWRSILLDFVVCLGAVVVALQAVGAKKYRWTAGFVAIALLFNPVAPILRLSGAMSLLLVLACIALFAISLATLKTEPVLSIPSITDRNPGSQSL
jgi:hypothetical protein